jgi:hypothetical protein
VVELSFRSDDNEQSLGPTAGTIVTEDGQPYNISDGDLFIKVTSDVEPVPEPSTYLAGALPLLPFGLQGIRHLRARQSIG